MANEQIIIEYVQRALHKVSTEELELRLNILSKLLNKFPSYQWDDVIKAVCEEAEEC